MSSSLRRPVAGPSLTRRALLGSVVAVAITPPVLAATTPVVVMDTALGSLKIAVFTDRAPISAADFLRYVDRGMYKDASFYRTVRPDNDPKPVKIDVIQGGLAREADMLPGVAHETTKTTGLTHSDGTISLARNQPGTGTAGAIFVCIGDQSVLDFAGARNPDGQGFAAFGRVVEGMDVARAIWRSPAAAQKLTPPIPILGARRV